MHHEHPVSRCCAMKRRTFELKPEIDQQEKQPGTPLHTLEIDHEWVELPGGSFLMGSDSHEGFASDGEGPVRRIELDPFVIDAYTVTNAQFNRFIRDTGYRTDAERYGWSYVFHLLLPETSRQADDDAVGGAPWWIAVRGAYWREPEGPGSSIGGRLDHPVVHVSWNDANAYCRWAGTRLPSEAEWEYAARGGLVQKRYPWGDILRPNGEHYCNIWQGVFPNVNHGSDGYVATAPAKSFPPNGYGLYNVAGNVWEWCQDWFSANFHLNLTAPAVNPTGPAGGTDKALRGGSYLCHRSYCNRYRVAARTSNTPDSSTGHTGFRCVKASGRP